MMRWLLATVLFGSVGTVSATAQEVGPLPNEWRAVAERLEPAAWEEVERLDGSKVRGNLVQLSTDGIDVQPRTRFPVPPVRVRLDEIRTIRQGRGDSLLNGAWWGLGIGTASGLTVLCGTSGALGGGDCFSGWNDPWVPAYAVGLGAGLGLAVGVGIDALRRRPSTVIYSRAAGSPGTAYLGPLTGDGRRGVRLVLRF